MYCFYNLHFFLLYYNNCRKLKHFGCRNWRFIQYWHQLSSSTTCIQFWCMHAYIHCCFYVIIDRTGNTLYAGNNAAFNTCKLEWLHPVILYSLINTLNVLQKGIKQNNAHLATKLRKFCHQIGCRYLKLYAIQSQAIMWVCVF